MSFSLRITPTQLRLSSIHNHPQGRNGPTIQRVSLYLYFPHLKHCCSWTHNNYHHFRAYPIGANGNAALGMSESQQSSADSQGSMEGKDSQQGKSLSTTKVLEQLKRYGVSGILSYGLLNTVYYLSAFLVVWFYFAPVPGKMGYLAAVTRFVKVMAMVWAGSQVTKLVRAAGRYAGSGTLQCPFPLYHSPTLLKSRN